MKKTKLLALLLAFLMLFSSVGVFAEENTQTGYQPSTEAIKLRDNIAQVLKDVEDAWSAFDMVAYSQLPDATVEMPAEVKQAVINACIDTAVSDTATASDLARVEIVLSSLEADTTELYAIGGNGSINNAELLNGANHTASGHYSVPWVLLANMQGAVNLTDAQVSSLIDVLSANAGDGTFGYEWDGITYPDADTAGAVLAALAPYYRINDDAAALVDLTLTGLGNAIGENGSFGSANSDAMVIIGLVALGENPYEFKNATSGVSVVDGLLSAANAQNNGFTFYGSENALATEQGFRALVALSAFDGTAYNIYDFSSAVKTVASQTINADVITLRDNIADVLKDVEDAWSAFDMVAYSQLPDATVEMAAKAKQAVINSCIDTAASDTATASDLARVEIVLRALGVDSQELYTYNSNEPVNNATTLFNANYTASGHYAAPWILLADLQGNLNLSEAQKSALITVLQQNSAGGTFGYEWDGIQYPDPDTAAAVLAALASLYDTDDEAKALCDEILTALDGMITESGSFGSVNSDAFVIIGLAAMGKNPADMKHATTGASVVDGLLSYVNEDNNGFTFYGAENFMATEQGFRALVVLSAFDGTAYNIYDFSDADVSSARQENGENATPTPPAPDASTMTVTMTIKTDSELWIYNAKVRIPVGGKVYDAFVAAINENGMTAVGADKGYVRSITKNGVTLSEYDKGKNSGWLYKVNGTKPSVGLTSYVLNEGDDIVWYYTEDWIVDFPGVSGGFGGGSGGGFGGGSPASKPEEPEQPETPTKPEVPTFADTDNHWAKDGIKYVTSLGIMNGVEEGKFAPDEKLTRGMLVTMLYRLSGDEVMGENEFLDIVDDAWFKDAAVWAKEKGITSGYGDGTFGADDSVTREQLVVFLMRYAELIEMDTKAEQSEFKDDGAISEWATKAINWAKSAGVVSGRDDGTFDPKGNATRGEIAVVFMRFCEMSR
ncbi:MAG: S-layer homology domain-containing protein [Clostridia bacterium]|nr:S-layer homology domain-containing protein [Clostridia bacterium]